jgi:hypothetical protein
MKSPTPTPFSRNKNATRRRPGEAKRNVLRSAATATLGLGALAVASCGNIYYEDWAPSYRQETMRLGEVQHEADARSKGMAGAGRAAVYGAEAAITNPAALASLSGPAAAGGGGYRSWSYSVQSDGGTPQAESFPGSFAGSYAAGAWPLAAERLVLGGALWTPHDYTYSMGGGDGANYEIKSRGALRAAGPAMGAKALGISWGVAGDFLFGGQKMTSNQAGIDNVDTHGRGYDVRASIGGGFDLAPGWRLSAAALGKKGAAVHFDEGDGYDVTFPPSAGAAFSLKAQSINVHVDYLYTFYESMESTDDDIARLITAVNRDVGWASLGGEYVTDGGAIVRAGFGYKPWYIRDATYGGVDSYHYAMGGGWPVMERRGRLDAALTYGRRGALDLNGYAVDFMEFQAGLNYYW